MHFDTPALQNRVPILFRVIGLALLLSSECFAQTPPAWQPIPPPNKGMEIMQSKWMEIPDNPTLVLDTFTVECWVKPITRFVIVSRDWPGNALPDWSIVFEQSQQRVEFMTGMNSGPDSYFWTPANSLVMNSWTHLAMVVNGPAGTARCYINGNLSASFSFAPRNFIVHTGLAWGGYYSNPGGATGSGIVDECRYWRGERTQSQIQALMGTDVSDPSAIPNLMGFWRFCDSYEDYSGTGNHGIPQGAPPLVLINLPFAITCGSDPCDSVDVFITGDTAFCENDSILLSASPGFVSYAWSTGDTTRTTVVRSSGMYHVIAIDADSCTAEADFEVSYRTEPLADAGPDITVCTGVEDTLGVPPSNPDWIYSWSPQTGLSDPDSASTRVRTDVSRRYVLTVMNEYGCIESDTVDVTVRDGLPLQLPDSLHICPGISIILPLVVLSGEPPYTFQWSPPETLSAADVQNPVATPPTSRWYHVVVTDAMGCTAEDSILIVVTGELESILPDSIKLCEGALIHLPLNVKGGTAPYKFHWWPVGSLSADNIQNPRLQVDTTRWYYVAIQDVNGCEALDSIHIIVGDELQTSMPDSIFICPNTSIELPLSVYGSNGGLQFDWTPEQDLSDAHVQRPRAQPKQRTMYRVHIMDSLGCEALDSIVVAFYPIQDLSITINGPSRFCIGDSVRLTATPGYASYKWYTPSGVSPDSGSCLIAREGGRYYVEVIDAHGCEVMAQAVTITVSYAFEIPIVVHGSLPLCDEDSVILEAAVGYTGYVWSDDSGRVIGAGRFITIGRAGKFTVVARDSNGCFGNSRPVDITIGEKPEFTVTGPRTVCINSIHDYSTLLRSRWSYEWTVNIGTIQGAADKYAARISWTIPGRMKVRLVVRDKMSGCVDSLDLTVNVVTELHPEIYANGPAVFCEGDSVLLRSRETYDNARWTDSTGRLLGTGSSLIVHRSGMYYFGASSIDSCHGIDSIRVTVAALPKPKITGLKDVCVGDTVSYQILTGSGFTQWSLTGGKVLDSSRTAITVLWDRPGSFILVLGERSADTTLRCMGYDSLRITVHALPVPVLTAWPDTVICRGDSIRLSTDPGHARYSWTTSAGIVDSTAHEIMIRESGLYSVSVTNAAGCIGISNNVSITVLEAPEPRIEGPISVCRDAIASYRVTGSGVTTSYWSISGGVFRSDPDSSAIEVKWGTAGIALLAVEVDNGLCKAYDTLRVTIGDSLKPVIQAMGPLAFCPGGEVQLDAGDGFDSYTWYTPDGIVTGQTITAKSAGTYRVRVTTASACAGTSDPILVTLIDGPSPQIVGPDLICPGDTAILEAPAGYVSYTWSDGTTGRFCHVIGPATRSVTVVDSNGCIGTSEIHVVASLEAPARPSITRTGDVLVSSHAATYQWYRNDTLLVGETRQECNILFPGRYSVSITNALGCPAISDTLFVGCAQGSSVVALPHFLVNPGETIVIDPTLQDNTCLEEIGTRDFIATIRFDKTLLVPLDNTPCGSIDGHDRVIEFTGSLQDLRTNALNLRFLVTLGGRDSIPLILEKFEWLDKPVTVNRIDGSLRLRICREGGDRLFDSEGQVRLAQNRPNPFNSVTIIDYEVIESAMTELFVMNSLGQRVRTLVQDHRTAGRYAVSFDAAELPSGSYILVLRTPTSVLHRAMSLVK